MKIRLRLFALSLTLSVVNAADDLDAPQTIASADDWIRQRDCAKFCYWASNRWHDLLGEAIGCTNYAYEHPNMGCQNLCYCRADLQPQAVSYLVSCINSACSKNSVDVYTATSLYLSYCTPKIAPVTARATTSNTTPVLIGNFAIFYVLANANIL